MLRNLAFVISYAVIQVLFITASVWAADFGSAEEAKAMLERAVAAVKEDKAEAASRTVIFMCSAPTPLTAS